ncbi:unnamed protein product [Acanthoscelides obtectus]|uniref:Uncharacterized protein n=1 Tax=Acanthoscelides obtectus TaxID=200917 RepID=A0A9P0L668_ACAOB|nr:unnamed protein product [Acanthoscelides obtectus]CAK1638304.1 hypothetical protein AOBTE_LOCUS10519 [Acanthoscelides obtectus]
MERNQKKWEPNFTANEMIHLFKVKVRGYAKILEDKKADTAAKSKAMLGTKLKKNLTPLLPLLHTEKPSH